MSLLKKRTQKKRMSQEQFINFLSKAKSSTNGTSLITCYIPSYADV